jgi:integrase
LILTGARRDEVGNLVHSEIDLSARRWLLPAARAKNKREHEIPLSDLAVSILESTLAREGREHRAAIFGDGPRRKGGSVRGFSGWSKAKAALDKRIEPPLSPWRLHDIRRSVATGMAELGVKPHVIEATLNHVSGHKAGVAGIYNHAAYAPEKQQALDRWAAHVEAIAAGKPWSNIVPLRA